MRPRVVSLLLPVLPTLSLLAGCYGYERRADAALRVGRPVELTLTTSGAEALAPQIGPSVEALRGPFVRDSAGAYVLTVQEAVRRTGAGTPWRGEQVAVPHQLVANVGERRLSGGRTAAAVALAAGAIAALALAFGGGEASGGRTGTGAGSGRF